MLNSSDFHYVNMGKDKTFTPGNGDASTFLFCQSRFTGLPLIMAADWHILSGATY